MFSWIISEIPKNTPDNKLYRRVQASWTIVKHLFWDLQAFFLGWSGIFLGIVRQFFGQNGSRVGGLKVFKGVVVLSNVNMCNRSKLDDHVTHPFKGRTNS